MPKPCDFTPRDRAWQPPALTLENRTSVARSPRLALHPLQNTLSELTGPVFHNSEIGAHDHDLLRNFARPGESPIGERINLHGRVSDENGRPVAHSLVELWQANAGGRYRHVNDSYLAPGDPNFGGCGRTLTDADGRYCFHTVKPGAYPWQNWAPHWRPAHIHLSVFGAGMAQRLITQCYFEGDPLIAKCPIVNAVPCQTGRDRLVASLDLEASGSFDHIAYRFDIVLRGRAETPFENRPEGS
mgnify:CR=1 FL=1